MREGMPRAASELLQTSLVSLDDTSRRLKQLSKVLKHRKAIDIVKDRSPGQPKQLRFDLEEASLILGQGAAPPRQLSIRAKHSTKIKSSPPDSKPDEARG